MSLCCTRRNVAHKSAFVTSPYLRWILGDLRFKRSLPHPDYIHRLIEHFRESSSPESMRRVVFSPDEILCEYVSASCHLPGAYVKFFPCPHCTHTNEEERPSFVEVFHFANIHEPDVCATVTFTMPAVITINEAMRVRELPGCSVQVEFTNGCPNAPIVGDNSARIPLHIHTDSFIEVLRLLPRSELDNMRLVSGRWSNVIGGAEGSLQQRRSFYVILKFYVESSGMLSVYFLRKERGDQQRILRVLTTRGLSQALYAVRSHFRNAFVETARASFVDSIPPPGPPRDVLVDIPIPLRVSWLMSLFLSMPRNSVIGYWSVQDIEIGFDSVLPLVRCALKAHKKLGCVQGIELALYDDGATWAQLAGLLNQPGVQGFSEIILSTNVSIDASELCRILSSRLSPTLHLYASGGTEPQDTLLALPAQLIRKFVALRDVSSFATEFSLRFQRFDNVVTPEMPYVNYATDRRKRFRYHLHGGYTVVRVHVYTNRAARECLTVVTIECFRGTVLFLKGDVSLSDLKWILRHRYDVY